MANTTPYKQAVGGVIRTADGAFIPENQQNRDYADFLAWNAVAGNTPLPIDPAPTVPLPWQAKIALAKTSVTMERITEAVALGKTTWNAPDVIVFLNHRVALRAIVSGADTKSTVLPVDVPFPAGT